MSLIISPNEAGPRTLPSLSATTAAREGAPPGRERSRFGVGRLLRVLGGLGLLVVGVVLVVSGLIPVLVAGLVLFFPALFPVFLVVLGLLAGDAGPNPTSPLVHQPVAWEK
jgi:hypothetical protein